MMEQSHYHRRQLQIQPSGDAKQQDRHSHYFVQTFDQQRDLSQQIFDEFDRQFALEQ